MNALDALGSPVRRAILEQLRARPLAVGELTARIADAHRVSRPAVSRHLKLLHGAGLVTRQVAGRRSLYAVDPRGFEPVREYLEGFWDEALRRFQLVADNLQPADEASALQRPEAK